MSKKTKIEEDAPELQELLITSQSEELPYVGLDIKRLTNAARELSCDVFIRISDAKMTRVFSTDTGLDFVRLRQYIEKGVKEIFVRREDFGIFTKYLQKSPEKILQDPLSSHDERVKALLDLSDHNVSDFFSKAPLEEVSVEKTKQIIRRMVSSLAKEPTILSSLMRMVQHHDFMLGHAVSVSIISMLVARGAQNANERTLELCGMGGFLHDIGKTQISRDIVGKYSDLTPEQWKEMRHHPLLGAKMLEGCSNVPEEVTLIVMQHHEQPGGSGYPTGMRGPKIFYPAKIVAIADGFAAMISNEESRKTYTPEQAISEMSQEVGKYDRELLSNMAALFKIHV